MQVQNLFYLGISIFISAILWFSAWLTEAESISVGLFTLILLLFLSRLGQRLCLKELGALLATVSWLVVPILFYHVFNQNNYYANLWVKYMKTSSENYYGFMLPATIAYCLGLLFPIMKSPHRIDAAKHINLLDKSIKKNGSVAVTLIGIGLFFSLLLYVTPAEFRFVCYLLSLLVFVGGLYALYSRESLSKIQSYFAVLVLILKTLSSGMFGDAIYFIVLSALVLMYGKEVTFYKKATAIFLGIFSILILQSIKSEYRSVVWKSGDADSGLFVDLILQRISDPSTLLNEYKLFTIATRLNQGWLISETMNNVPSKVPFADGETIVETLNAVLIPRFLDPEKRKSGGVANVERFLGWKNTNVSMNISPVGEGYANFGVTGGIIFIFFYGLIISFFIDLVMYLSIKRPTFLLWVPFLFFYTIVVETDMLTTYNFLFKSFIFLLLFFPMFHSVFKKSL